MSDRPVLASPPLPNIPITVEPTGKHVTVRVNGEVVADTDEALTLQEATYPAVQYIPIRDVVAADVLTLSGTEPRTARSRATPATTTSSPTGGATRRRRDLDLREAVPCGGRRSPVMSRSIRHKADIAVA